MTRHRKRVSRACWADRWPLERALFAMAGTVTAISAVLAITVSKWFALIAAFVAVNQWLYVAVGACGASLILSRLGGLRSGFDRAEAVKAAPGVVSSSPVAGDLSGRRGGGAAI